MGKRQKEKKKEKTKLNYRDLLIDQKLRSKFENSLIIIMLRSHALDNINESFSSISNCLNCGLKHYTKKATFKFNAFKTKQHKILIIFLHNFLLKVQCLMLKCMKNYLIIFLAAQKTSEFYF